MAVITWQNVPGADLGSALGGIRNAADLFQRAGDNAQGAVGNIAATQAAVDAIKQAEVNRTVTQEMLAAPDSTTYQKTLANGLAQGNLVDGRHVQLSPEMQLRLDARRDLLTKREADASAQAELDKKRTEAEVQRKRDHAVFAAKEALQPILARWEPNGVYHPEDAQKGFMQDVLKLQASGKLGDIPPGVIEEMTHNLREKYIDTSGHMQARLGLTQLDLQRKGAALAERVRNESGNDPTKIKEIYASEKDPLVRHFSDLNLSMGYKGKDWFEAQRNPDASYGQTGTVDPNATLADGTPVAKVERRLQLATQSVAATPESEYDSLFDAAVKNNTEQVKMKAPGKNSGTFMNNVTKLPESSLDAATKLAKRIGKADDEAAVGHIKDMIDAAYDEATQTIENKDGSVTKKPRLNYAEAAELVGSRIEGSDSLFGWGDDLGKGMDFKGFREEADIRKHAKLMAEAAESHHNKQTAKQLSYELAQLMQRREQVTAEISKLKGITEVDFRRGTAIPTKEAELSKLDDMIKNKMDDLKPLSPKALAGGDD